MTDGAMNPAHVDATNQVPHVTGDNEANAVPLDETLYLLRSEAMRRRLIEAAARRDGMSLEEACERLRL